MIARQPTRIVTRAIAFSVLITTIFSWIGHIAAPPLIRIALAFPFLRSGLTKWDGFLSISPGTTYLFEEQFKLHFSGGIYDLPAPEAMAVLVACAEIVLPSLLLLGLGTRWAASGLLIMTCVIQLVFPEGWQNFHLYWAALALSSMGLGPGSFSLDHLLKRVVFAPAKANYP